MFEFSMQVSEQPVMINPEAFLATRRPLLEGRGYRRERWAGAPVSRQMLCHFCLFGWHQFCEDRKCPCIHRKIVKENSHASL